jgi:predicted nucleic acid-binding protein
VPIYNKSDTLAAMRIMLDTNVHDLIAADHGVRDAILKRIEYGQLRLVSTHIQRDELARAPGPKRDALLAIYGLAEKVPTTGAMFDVSCFDEASWGTDEASVSTVALMAGNHKHAEDALIAATASNEADVLVTDDTRLASKIPRAGFTCEVWSWGQFVEWLNG